MIMMKFTNSVKDNTECYILALEVCEEKGAYQAEALKGFVNNVHMGKRTGKW